MKRVKINIRKAFPAMDWPKKAKQTLAGIFCGKTCPKIKLGSELRILMSGCLLGLLTCTLSAQTKSLKVAAEFHPTQEADYTTTKVYVDEVAGTSVPRDFHKIVEYYMQHYESVIKRLFNENGYEIVKDEPAEALKEQ